VCPAAVRDGEENDELEGQKSGRLAQLEEQLAYNQQVVGSSPAAPTNALTSDDDFG
jgi:hypothetical protein